MPLRLELYGQKFGRLLAIEPDEKYRGKWKWLCKCDCGRMASVVGSRLIGGHTRSCGCIRTECAREMGSTYKHLIIPGDNEFARKANKIKNMTVKQDTAERMTAFIGQSINGVEILQLLPRNAHGELKFWLRCPCPSRTEFAKNVYEVTGGKVKSCGCRTNLKNPYEKLSDEGLTEKYTETVLKLNKLTAAFEARGLSLPANQGETA